MGELVARGRHSVSPAPLPAIARPDHSRGRTTGHRPGRRGGRRIAVRSTERDASVDRGPDTRDGDERFKTVTARRPVLEQTLRLAAEAEAGIDIRRGVSVRELVVNRYNGTPHVSGVRTEAGEELHADLVVDAMGRRSQLPRWLGSAGAASVHEEVEDAGFIYYTRYFRARTAAPGVPGPAGHSHRDVLTSDSARRQSHLVGHGVHPRRRAAVQTAARSDVWTALVAACPRHAQWLDGEPITDVVPMGGIVDRYRRFRGLTCRWRPASRSVGDAWACTNPSNGRGMSLGLMHVQRLRDVIRAHLADPLEFAEVWDAVTEAELTPWYRENVEEDRDRIPRSRRS